jgi:hypothetical protein
VRLIGLLLTLAMIAGLVWYLLGDIGRDRATTAVEKQVDEARRLVRGVEKTVGAGPMERLQEEDKEEMRRLIRERTQTR